MGIIVKKRDGRVVEFDVTRITKAISKAMNEVGKLDEVKASQLADKVTKSLKGGEETVEHIQDIVEKVLMASSLKDVARAYIIYREKRNRARKATSNQVIADIIAAKKNDITRENANMNADTPAGMMMKIASESSKSYVDEMLLSSDVADAVKKNILHIHDKDYYPTRSLTCIQSPIDRILEQGFVAGHGESRGAKRIETASILAAVSLQTTQNEQHGGQAIPAFDFYMAPYVRKSYIEEIEKLASFTHADLSSLKEEPVEEYVFAPTDDILGTIQRAKQHAINMTVHRVHQSMEAFIHNMNTIHSRGGRVA